MNSRENSYIMDFIQRMTKTTERVASVDAVSGSSAFLDVEGGWNMGSRD